MAPRFFVALERPVAGFDADAVSGKALAQVVELHPALTPLLDFYSADPTEIAAEIGMVSPHDPEDADDLLEIDLGPEEWFEPTAGLVAVRQALEVLRVAPASLAAAVYAPGLRPEAVGADLEAIERSLLLARQHETRFHFTLDT